MARKRIGPVRGIRMSTEMWRALDVAAQAEGLSSRSALVVRIVSEWLEGR